MSLQTRGTISIVSFERPVPSRCFCSSEICHTNICTHPRFPQQMHWATFRVYIKKTHSGLSISDLQCMQLEANLAWSRDEDWASEIWSHHQMSFVELCLQLLLCHHSVWLEETSADIYLLTFIKQLLPDFGNIFHAVALPKTGKQTLMCKMEFCFEIWRFKFGSRIKSCINVKCCSSKARRERKEDSNSSQTFDYRSLPRMNPLTSYLF